VFRASTCTIDGLNLDDGHLFAGEQVGGFHAVEIDGQ
jgi:hypothetical protein